MNLPVLHATTAPTSSALQYNPFEHTASHTGTLGFVCGLCLSSLVTFTLFSLMRPIRLPALCIGSGLVWCGAFHYAGQLKQLGNACKAKKKREELEDSNRWTMVKTGNLALEVQDLKNLCESFDCFFCLGGIPTLKKTHDLNNSRSSSDAIPQRWITKTHKT